jgi:regulatory protein
LTAVFAVQPAAAGGTAPITLSREAMKPKPHLNESGLYDYAIKALGRHMRTEAELRRLMRMRVEPGERGQAVTDATIARLKENGYIDDAAYAEIYARLRQQNEKLGQRRVSQSLTQKGVSRQIVTTAIEARYADTNEEALARQHLERKRIRKPTNEKETARVMRRLVGAGFSTGVIYKILRQWNVPDESLLQLDNLADEPGDPAAE